MQYPHGATIAVTDGRRLRIFRNTGDEVHLKLEELPEPAVAAHGHGATRAHHGGNPNPTERKQEETSYASSVAHYLNGQVLAGHITQLFLVAPPHALGELRPRLHAQLTSRLIGELGKEHTHDSLAHIHKALLAVAA
jgi:protein required for attachment to host cells